MNYSASDFAIGKNGPQFVWLSNRLDAHGFPSTHIMDSLKSRVQRFQWGQGWTGSSADGFVGPVTLTRLTANPTQPKPQLPAELVDLLPWKLTTPFGKDGSPTEVLQPGLARFADARCFFVRDDAVVFRVTGDGVTTSGSSYPRSELREMSGTSKASWDTRQGTHTIQGEYAATGNAKVVLQQIHDADDDLVMVSWQAGSIVAEFSSGKGQGSEKVSVGIASAGQWFKVQTHASGGTVVVSVNGVNKVKRARPKAGCYAKAGAYLQSDDPNSWAEVSIKRDTLKVIHE